ncbi:cytochrome P450 [Nocardiopsis sp. HNM0947]|uniref:Cytochrome P450 n=1 Tax=Nocardiopsis coralli TaxID=2772213 RepID=A0ABR9P077_9ACTN|nr:cytochrome P450 [Nocardiopsis coralli]MBE2997231.1 cytochrome P450 [Nocardiopsis coralli]
MTENAYAPRFPEVRENPYDPPSSYRLGRGGPYRTALSYGGHAWMVTDLETARAVLADVRFSSDSTNPDYPNLPLSSKHRVPGHFLSMDPPDHTAMRRMVTSDFSATRVRRLRPKVDTVVSDLINTLVGGGASSGDLTATVAVPLPGAGTAEMFGVPEDQRSVFMDCARRLQIQDATTARRVAISGRTNRLLTKMIEAKADAPGNDILSRLARLRAGGALTTEQAVGIANLILVAGLETVAGLFSLTMLSLLRDESQRRLISESPRRWAGPAVNESLRYWTVIEQGVARVCTDEVEIGGQLIRKGDAVIVHLPTVNRDPSVFPCPDEFDMTRNPQGHLAFGHGVHHCLGSSVAQLQTELAVTALFERLPQLRLIQPEGPFEFLDDMLVYGLRELQVTWS